MFRVVIECHLVKSAVLRTKLAIFTDVDTANGRTAYQAAVEAQLRSEYIMWLRYDNNLPPEADFIRLLSRWRRGHSYHDRAPLLTAGVDGH